MGKSRQRCSRRCVSSGSKVVFALIPCPSNVCRYICGGSRVLLGHCRFNVMTHGPRTMTYCVVLCRAAALSIAAQIVAESAWSAGLPARPLFFLFEDVSKLHR